MRRAAGQSLVNLGKWLFANQDAGEIALRVAPDIGFGILEGAMMPEGTDLMDRVIAGGSSGLGGLTGGIALGKLGGKNPMLVQALDMAGSIGGDFAGRAVGDQALRIKDTLSGGAGETPYERLNAEQMELYKQQVETQLLADLGLLPSGVQTGLVDSQLVSNGLGA